MLLLAAGVVDEASTSAAVFDTEAADATTSAATECSPWDESAPGGVKGGAAAGAGCARAGSAAGGDGGGDDGGAGAQEEEAAEVRRTVGVHDRLGFSTRRYIGRQ